MKTEPMKFPRQEVTQFFMTSPISTAPERKPDIMTITLPVKSSAPVRTTSVRPVGRPTAPFRKAESPGLAEARAGEPPPTTVMSSAPMPIRQPAAKPRTMVLSFEKPALALDAPTSALYTAGGGCAVELASARARTPRRRARTAGSAGRAGSASAAAAGAAAARRPATPFPATAAVAAILDPSPALAQHLL